MKNSFFHTCKNENVFSSYIIDSSNGHTYIKPAPNSAKTAICPFDNAIDMVLEYLLVGFMFEKGQATDTAVLDFVSKYGFLKRGVSRLNASAFAEDANGLYLHFCEISASDYPDSPEWVLETEPASFIIERKGSKPIINWQTESLASSIEVAYTLLICGEQRQIGLCKHCGTPYKVKNPKSEFCSPVCRNRYNVYKSRAKR